MICRGAIAAGGLALSLLLVGCRNADLQRQEDNSAAATPKTDVTGQQPTPDETHVLPREWVAVFRVAEVEDLREEKEELLRLVPENIAVAPVSCWVGLPEKLGDPRGYVSAVWARSRTELDRVVGKVEREPILVGEFPAMCAD